MTMWAWIRRLLAPPVFEGDEDKTRIARWTNLLLWAEILLVVLSSSLLPITGTFEQGAVPIAAILLLCAVGLWVLHAGRVQLAGIVFAGSLWLVSTGLTLVSGGLRDQGPTSYFFVVIVAGLLLGGRAAIGFAVASALACGAVFYADLVGVLPPNVMAATRTFGISMIIANLAMTATVLYLLVQSISDALAEARRSASDLAKQGQELAVLVDDRTRELARRTAYLGATTAVVNEAARVLDDPQQLLSRAVSVISEQFGFYHVGIFLLDAQREWAQLRAASSSGGQQMLERRHRLQVGSQGIVGYVAARGEPRIALHVEEDAAFLTNPDLPDTRAEMAVPLRARGEMIGVLDVQSREPEAFSEEDVQVLQALADQVSLAISSARLFVQLEGRLEAERRVYGELTREAWLALLRAQSELGFLSDEQGTVRCGQVRSALALGMILLWQYRSPCAIRWWAWSTVARGTERRGRTRNASCSRY
jgi:putative methionine-R-sulfoxide reductase with GAF domain